MSSQIQPVLVKDSLLQLDDKIGYAVFSGGQNVSYQKFNATSYSNTSHTYNIQVPSTSTVMSREVIWGSEITFSLTGTAPAKASATEGPNGSLFQYGKNIVVAPYPLNNLCTNMAIQINNTTVQLPVNQVLDPLLRCIDDDKVNRYNSGTPTQLDYVSYACLNDTTFQYDNVLSTPFSGALQVFDRYRPPRGAFYVELGGVGNPDTENSATVTQTIKIKVREPLMVPPFIFGDGEGASGLTGITQINITAQMDALAKRAIRWLSTLTAENVVISNVGYSDSYMECKFLSPKPSDLIPATVITPLVTYTNYILNSKDATAVPSGDTLRELISNSVQLNSIPDKVFLFVRPSQATLNNTIADCYGTIEKVSITMGAQSGILSNAEPIDLFRMSAEAGCKQTWLEFNSLSLSQGNYPAVATNLPNGKVVNTCGGLVVLDFARHINVSETFYAPGSLQSQTFQVYVHYKNKTGISFVPELNMMFMTSGVLSTSNGSSSAYTSGVLSKQVVLDALTQEAVNPVEIDRMVGGNFLSGVKAFTSKLIPKLPTVAKHLLGMVQHPVAQKGAEVLGEYLGAGEDMEGEARRRRNRLKGRLI